MRHRSLTVLLPLVGMLVAINCSSEPSGPDSCAYAYDDMCDEPDLCDPGTDSWDCDDVGSGAGTPEGGCAFTNDGECDEPGLCDPGTDSADCGASADSCEYAHDGECDEPTYCYSGTDTTDCSAVPPAPTCGQPGDSCTGDSDCCIALCCGDFMGCC